MLYLSVEEILKSISYSVAFGIASGLVFELLGIVPEMLRILLKIPKDAETLFGNFTLIGGYFRKGRIQFSRKMTFIGIVLDFVAVISICVGYSVLMYVASDGVFRIYVLMFSSVSFWMFLSTFGKWTRAVFLKMFDFFAKIATVAIVMLSLPQRILAKKLTNSTKNGK